MNQTQTENLLKLLNKAIKENLIFEKTSIKHFKDAKRVLQKNITTQKLNTKIIITPFELETKKTLLVSDFPQNQILSYFLMANKNTKLYQFQLIQKQENELNLKKKTYISDEKTKEILKKQKLIETSTIKSISAKQIINKKITKQFQPISQIQKIKEYLDSKQIPNNIIMENNSIDGIQNFNPTLKNTHFKLAQKIEIPIIPQIENEFIINENINIFDLNKIIEKINPIAKTEEKIKTSIEKKSKKRTYLDVSTTYHIKIDTSELIRKINHAIITSEPKEKIIHSIKNLTQTEITQKNGEVKLPLWKIHSSQDYIKINNFEHFNQITGINFPQDKTNLHEIYIQNTTGEKGILKNQYIKKRYQTTFQTLPENQVLVYRKPLDLAIKSILEDNLQIIIKYQKVSQKQIEKLLNLTSELVEVLIIETIKFNQISNQINNNQNDQTQNQKYFESLTFKLINEFENFLKTPKKTTLIHKTNFHIKNLKKFIKTNNLTQPDLFYLTQLILQTTKITSIFDTERTNQIKQRFSQYFDEKKYKIKKNQKPTNPKEYQKINHTQLLSELINKSKKTNQKIYLLNKTNNLELKNSLLQIENLQILNEEPKFKIRLKPNYKLLKTQFPNHWKNVANQIKQIIPGQENPKIKLGKIETKLKLEQCEIKKIYENYKTVSENEYFSILKENSEINN